MKKGIALKNRWTRTCLVHLGKQKMLFFLVFKGILQLIVCFSFSFTNRESSSVVYNLVVSHCSSMLLFVKTCYPNVIFSTNRCRTTRKGLFHLIDHILKQIYKNKYIFLLFLKMDIHGSKQIFSI